MRLHIPPGRSSSPPVTEAHGKGGLHTEIYVPGWHNLDGLRTGGLHIQFGRPDTQTKSQPHRLPWLPGTKLSLVRARHARETRERRHVELQHRSPHTRRAPCRHDLGADALRAMRKSTAYGGYKRGRQFLSVTGAPPLINRTLGNRLGNDRSPQHPAIHWVQR